MVRLILIRHGETDSNLERRYTGYLDVPLNARGKRQAKALADRLQPRPIDWIYSSDLIRARQTAEILGMATGTEVRLDRRLREIHLGEWEGSRFDDIRASQPETWKRRLENPLEVHPPGGEDMASFRKRVLEALDDILRLHADQLVAIVTHGLVLSVIKLHHLGLPIEAIWDQIPENAKEELITIQAL
ncbi:MAG: histidine phosphatase family protein [Anaerolineales bacterium]|jgi:alpha-ribazole phosphatase